MTNLVSIVTTAATVDDIKQIARTLLDRQLVACVNITETVHSLYEWEGVQEEKEALGTFHTRAALADDVMQAIGKAHPYDTPQILVLPVAAAHAGYAQWVADSTPPTTT